jgi:hypothetical protein
MLEYKYPYFARTQSDGEAENTQATDKWGGGWNWLLKSEYHFTSAHKYALSVFQLVNIK